MGAFRYILEKGSKKHVCPNCEKKAFVRYIDIVTGDYLPETYGRCDRESKCNYHLNPYSDGYAKAILEQGNSSVIPNRWKAKPKVIQPTKAPVFIPFDVLQQTLKPERYSQNVFIQNLLNRVAYPFNTKEVEAVTSLYYLGTIANGYRAGAITFPFIDIANNIRAVQVKQFDEANHTTGTGFLHSLIESHYTKNNQPLPDWLKAYNENDLKVSCLFGEHLLKRYPNNPIGLVEAPKTAIYCSLYFGLPSTPTDLIWLAVYNKSSFTFDKLKTLQGRNIFVFPDLSKDGNTFVEWQGKANEFEKRLQGTRFIFSDLLEQLAPETDKYNGNDIADYLIKLDWRKFRKQPVQEQPNLTKPDIEKPKHKNIEGCIKYDAFKTEPIEYNKPVQHESWDRFILELEAYFENIELPTHPVKLNGCSTITDYSLFIENHFATVKGNNGNRTFLPHLNRLQELKRVLTNNLN